MAKTAAILGVLAALWAMSAHGARGQRIQFPTPLETSPTGSMDAASTGVPGASPGWVPVTRPTYYTPPTPSLAQAPVVGSTPVYPPTVAPGSVVTVPPSFAPSTAPGLLPGPVPGPAPPAALQGTIQPPPGWDPYATPGMQPAPLFSQDPVLTNPFGPMPPLTKFLQEVRVEEHWFWGNTASELGINEIDCHVTFAFPFLWNAQNPLLVTPGFGLHLWEGPVTTALHPVDLPPQTYDAYLNAAWNPQISPWFGAELGAGVGVFSDFTSITSNSIRIQGHALAVLSFTPSFQLKGGVVYLDRNRYKLLPAGGIVWTPNADNRFEILFPNPRFAHRITTLGTADWWLYARGEYGGGAWTVKRAFIPGVSVTVPGEIDRVDYNDIRVAVGLEAKRPNTLSGFFEVGVAFNRELFYVEPNQTFRPDTTFFLGGGFWF